MADEPATVTDAVKLATRYGAIASRNSAKVKDLTAENAKLREQNAKLTGDVEKLTKQVGTPSEQAQRIAQLETENRTFKHRAAFAELAEAEGARKDAIGDLFDSLKLPVDGDPDPEKLKTAIEAAKASKAWAFAAPAAAGDGKGGQQQEPPPKKPIPGQGRGGANNGSDATIITPEQLADPKFMLDPSKQEAILSAAKEGRFAR